MRPGKGTTGIHKWNRKGRCLEEKDPSSDSEPKAVTEVTPEGGWEKQERITASQTGKSAEKEKKNRQNFNIRDIRSM